MSLTELEGETEIDREKERMREQYLLVLAVPVSEGGTAHNIRRLQTFRVFLWRSGSDFCFSQLQHEYCAAGVVVITVVVVDVVALLAVLLGVRV